MIKAFITDIFNPFTRKINILIKRYKEWAEELITHNIGPWHDRLVCPCGYSHDLPEEYINRNELYTFSKKILKRCPDCSESIIYDVITTATHYTFKSNWEIKVMRWIELGPRIGKRKIAWQMRVEKSRL